MQESFECSCEHFFVERSLIQFLKLDSTQNTTKPIWAS
jgi:hypothetical protein